MSSEGKNLKALVDKDNSTHWNIDDMEDVPILEITLPKPEQIDVLSLQENIRVGQRIEKFKLEYLDGDTWEVATSGTTVGYKRLLRFESVEANKFKLIIESARLQPALCEVGLYKHP